VFDRALPAASSIVRLCVQIVIVVVVANGNFFSYVVKGGNHNRLSTVLRSVVLALLLLVQPIAVFRHVPISEVSDFSRNWFKTFCELMPYLYISRNSLSQGTLSFQ